MPIRFDTLLPLVHHGFDAVIDVRSPSEFTLDHLPGAINLAVLDDAERARVGTIYKQQSPFRARKIGAALVFRNASRQIEDHLQGYERDWRPLIYCWRGGQRSGAFAWMLREIGWRAEVLEGGYRSFRRLVHGALYETPLVHRLVLLDGQTGTAKTDLLKRAAQRGVQVLDLEGAARHRGSLLGDGPHPQPTQKAFESEIACALARHDPARPVLVEAESSKIGRLNLPPMLWDAMQTAPRIDVNAPLTARVEYLCSAYADILRNTEKLRTRLSYLRAVRGSCLIDHWMDLIAAGDTRLLTRSLICDHYDPAYDSARRKRPRRVRARIDITDLNEAGLARATDTLANLLA